MALVLGATGLFVYLRLGAALDRSVDQGLRSRSSDVAALVQQADSGLAQGGKSALTERGESFAQVLDTRGRVVDSTPQVRNRPLLSPAEVQRARRGPVYLERARVPGFEDGSRLLATPVRAQGGEYVTVVGASLEDRSDALHNLGILLLIGGPAALLLASLAGYGVAAAALRPVEAMRRRATEISAGERGARLPVPPAQDELSRLGTTLNALLERLEAAFEREREFVSDASHELRTPLAILKTEVELALLAGRDVEELRAALGSVADETDRLSQLAEDLLVIARSDQGRLPVRAESVDVRALLERVSGRVGRRASSRGRTIEVSVPGGLCITADQLRLEQALGNMLDNAVRYGEGTVTVSAEQEDASVVLRVADAGAGFPPGFVADAFERFSRADPARGRGGAGLGLAIVAAIAKAHGGKVGAGNPPAGGAEVWMSIPGPPERP
jgi:two-component system OmpR family sensor kinase